MKNINWGWKIVIAMAVFMIATGGWVAYAMTHDVDLVRNDYYEYSLKHDQTMQARSRATALGSTASIEFDSKANIFIVTIPSSQAKQAKGVVALYRPNDRASDKQIALALAADGTMCIPADQLAKGIWQITTDWTCDDTSYELIASRTL